jgi:hypothetical protein
MGNSIVNVPMSDVWVDLMREVNTLTGSRYDNPAYVRDVARGTKKNAAIGKVVVQAVRNITLAYKARGMRPRYRIL